LTLLAPSLDPGGSERQMLTLAQAIDRSRFDVRFLLLSNRGALATEAEALGISVQVLGLRRDGWFGSRRSTAAAVGAARASAEYIRLARNVDIVDAWLVPAYTFAGVLQPVARVPILIGGRRAVYGVHRTRTWVRELAGRFAVRRMDAIVANSAAAASDAIVRERLDPAKVHVIRNAVTPLPVDREVGARLRRIWGFAPSDVVVGCVGNLRPGKGQDVVIQVATELRDAFPILRYVLVGDGPQRPAIEMEIERRGLRSHVVIHAGETDARRVYAAFDVAIQASESEGMPNAVLEAAAAGLPIVATDAGGTREIITSERDGILVPVGDIGSLTAAVARVTSDPDLRVRMGIAAARRSLDFTPARLAQETADLYLRLIESSGVRS
jgi:glycosyltransferase involved in cell wall biosynthesis